MFQSKWIKADGTEQDVTPASGTSFSLEELQTFVGGYIGFVRLPEGRVLVVNSDGYLTGLPINEKATEIVSWPPVVGDVLLTDRAGIGEEE